jgi:hypothetical protein
MGVNKVEAEVDVEIYFSNFQVTPTVYFKKRW